MLIKLFCIIILTLSSVVCSVAQDVLPFENSRYTNVNGIDLHYRLWKTVDGGKGNVLFVHGFMGSTFSWRKNAGIVNAAGYNVVAVDLPAYGYSSKKTGFDHSIKKRAELLWGLLKKLESQGVVPYPGWNLVGHSMGGKVVAEMAVQKPELTSKLVLVDPAMFERKKNSFGSGEMLKRKDVRENFERIIVEKFVNKKGIQQFLDSAYGQKASHEEVEGFLTPLLVPGTIEAILDSFITAASDEDVKVENIKAQALIIWGAEDSWVKIDIGKKLLKRINGSTLYVIKKAGHCSPETNSEEFNKTLISFLGQ
ncbi:MAG: alpha/beta hydrolase [Elusimicrobiota bacterium]